MAKNNASSSFSEGAVHSRTFPNISTQPQALSPSGEYKPTGEVSFRPPSRTLPFSGPQLFPQGYWLPTSPKAADSQSG